MQIGISRNDPDRGIACAAIRLFLTVLGGTAWMAVWTVVYCPVLGF